MEETISFIKHVFIKTWQLFTGLDYFEDLPRISGRFYIHRPRIFERRNTRTKQVGYIEVIAELPQAKPSTYPEYMVVIMYRSWKDRLRPYMYVRMTGYISERIKRISKHFPGPKHFFIYIIYRRCTQGVIEQHKRVFARLPDNYVFRITSIGSIVISDLVNYIHKRVQRLLDPKLYYKSNYEIFGRPKRLAEYLLMLEALLNRRRDLATQIAYILHNTSRLQVTKLLNIQSSMYNISKEETRRRKEQEAYTPSLFL